MDTGFELTNGHLDYLTVCLVRSESVIQRALSTVEPEIFEAGERHYALLWAVSRDFYRLHHQLCPVQAMRVECDKRVQGDPNWNGNPFLKQQIDELIKMIYDAGPADIISSYGQSILQRLLESRLVRKAISSNPNVPEMVKAVNQAWVNSRVTSASSVDIFDLTRPELNTSSAPRVPTGFAPFDLMLNGGPAKGEFYLVMGPFSGGKTMMSMLAGLSNAKNTGEWTLFFGYEEGCDPKIRERAFVAASAVDRKLVEGIAWDKLDPITRGRIEGSASALRKFRVFDMSGNKGSGYGGIEEVEAAVQNEIMQGRKPGAILIDWAGVMARRHLESLNLNPDDYIRGELSSIADGCKRISEKYGVWTVLCHQLSGVAGGAGVGRTASAYDGSDNKQLAALATAMIVIGTRDTKSMLTKISNPKARCGGDGSAWVRVDSVHHQMTLDNHEYAFVPDRDGSSSLKRVDQMNTLGDVRDLSGMFVTSMPTQPSQPAPTNLFQGTGEKDLVPAGEVVVR